MDVFRLIHPHPHTRMGEPVDIDIPVMRGRRLQQYFRERRLIGLSTTCRVVLDRTNQPLRLSYEPKPNDVIVMRRGAGGVQ